MVQEALLFLAEQTDSLDFPNQKGKKIDIANATPPLLLRHDSHSL